MKKFFTIYLISLLLISCKNEFQILCNPNFETLNLRNGLSVLTNYQQALFCSKEYDIPMFIYFTGYGSIGCAKTEEFFYDGHLAQSTIRKLITENFILVALYVDDAKTIRSEDLDFVKDWMSTKGISNQNRKIRTVGNLNAQIQIGLTKKNSQPFFLALDKNEQAIIDGFGYTNDSRIFKSKIEEAITLLNAE